MKKLRLRTALSALSFLLLLLCIFTGCGPKECLHVGGEWTVDVAPTCTAKGSRHQVCGLCGITVAIEEVDVIAHDYSQTVEKPNCITAGTLKSVCSVCGAVEKNEEVSPAVGHTLDVSGCCSVCKQYFISTAAQLTAFASAVNGGNPFSGKMVSLMGNIDMKGADWTPVGTADHPFDGIFEGNGYTVSNYKLSVSESNATPYVGFFGYSSGSIYNLTLMRSTLYVSVNIGNGALYAGELLGYNDGGAVWNCTVDRGSQTLHFSASSSTGNCKGYFGGAIGYNKGGELMGVSVVGDEYYGTVSGSITAANSSGYVGGLLGYSRGGRIERCYADVRSDGSVYGVDSEAYVGGLVGYLEYVNLGISNCYARGAYAFSRAESGTVSNYNKAYGGSFAGYVYQSKVTNCYATGHSQGPSDTTDFAETVFLYIGGFAGGTDTTSTFSGCFSLGYGNAVKNTEGNYYASGFIAGGVGSDQIKNCYENSSSLTTGYVIHEDAIKTDIFTVKSVEFLTKTLGFSTDVWNITGADLPTLK